VTVEDLAKQWPSSAWHRFRLLEGHKGPLATELIRPEILVEIEVIAAKAEGDGL
jgi:hypothetical protein